MPFAPNGQRELLIGHNDERRTLFFIQANLDHLRGREGIGNKFFGLWRPLHHVYFLAIELVDDVLNADTAHPYARPDRVYALLPGGYGDLGS